MSDQQDMSLHRLITTTLTTLGSLDPREIAEAVADATPDELVREFYLKTVVAEVRSVLATQRNNAMSKALNPSAKLAQRRDWWAEMLASAVHVGGGLWVTIGECGPAELSFCARERRADAEREIKRAEAFDKLRSLLRKHKVEKVEDLPADAARDAVTEVAAA